MRLFKGGEDVNAPGRRGLSGKIFELLIVDALHSKRVGPIYHQASIMNVPNVRFDNVLYHPKNPAVISCKTSLRERWKQADLEGSSFKQVYRRGTSVLVTFDKEGYRIQKKISDGDVFGLDRCVVIEESNNDFDELLDEFAKTSFQEAIPVNPVNVPRVGAKSDS